MAEKLMEIKEVGIKTVSGFLSEVGDIRRSVMYMQTVEEAVIFWNPYPMFADARVIRYRWFRKI